jgi:adenylate kinase family enzyme
MGWYSTWEVDFKPNTNGEIIYDLWDQELVEKLIEEKFSHFIDIDINKGIIFIKYGYYCELLQVLYELYKFPIKCKKIENAEYNYMVGNIEYYPSRYEWDYDDELENIIKVVEEKEDIIGTKEEKYEKLAKIMYNIHYK